MNVVKGKWRLQTAMGDSCTGIGGGGCGAAGSMPGTRAMMYDVMLRVSSIELPDARLSSDVRCARHPQNLLSKVALSHDWQNVLTKEKRKHDFTHQ